MTNQQTSDQQHRIAREFLGLHQCPASIAAPDHWYDADTWHVDPAHRGKPERLPCAEDARWGARIKTELQIRCLSFKVKWALDVGWFCEILGVGYTCIKFANTESAALMAAVEQILEGEQ